MTHDEPDTRTMAEHLIDLMLAADTGDSFAVALERQLLGVVLAHGRTLREIICRSFLPPEAFVGPRHRLVWMYIASTCNLDGLHPDGGAIAQTLCDRGLDGGGLVGPYLNGLALADSALAAASAQRESPEGRFIRLASSLLDGVVHRQQRELRRLQSALRRVGQLKSESIDD